MRPSRPIPTDKPSNDVGNEHRSTLIATFVTGGATIVVALVGLIRAKGLAVLVGPAGLGTMGLINGAMTTLASLACLGLTFSGVRQIAVSSGAEQRRVRQLIWLLGMAGAASVSLVCIVWWPMLSRHVGGFETVPRANWWVAAGIVALTVAGLQSAVLQGLHQIKRLAQARIIGAVIGAAAGVGAVAMVGTLGLAFAVLAVPLGNVIGNALRPPPPSSVGGSKEKPEPSPLRALLSLGTITLATGTAASLWQFATRALIAERLSLEDAGLYQAAFALSAMNIALVLSALGTDYFPRLSKVAGSHADTRSLVDSQFQAAIVLAAPLLLGLIALAPIALKLLYTDQFSSAWPLLQWQVLGDILKIPSWIFGFVLMVNRRGKIFLFLELGFTGLILALTYVMLPLFGLVGAGIAYTTSYGVYSIAALAYAGGHGGRISKKNGLAFAVVSVAGGTAIALSMANIWAGMGFGIIATAIASLATLTHLRRHDLIFRKANGG